MKNKGLKIFIILLIIAGVLWWGYTYKGWFQGTSTTNGAGQRGLAYDTCIKNGGTWGALPNGGLGCIYSKA